MVDPEQKLSLHGVSENVPKIGNSAQSRDENFLTVKQLTLLACQKKTLHAL
jgi:hypothetical protein